MILINHAVYTYVNKPLSILQTTFYAWLVMLEIIVILHRIGFADML